MNDLYKCRRCRCGFCYENCPTFQLHRFESSTPRGINAIALAVFCDELNFDKSIAEWAYRCITCGFCQETCSAEINTVDITKNLRNNLVERGLVPPKVRDFLYNIYNYGNPWKEPRKNRGNWIEDLDIKRYESINQFLYYVGCVGSYDTRANRMAKALARILLESGIAFGILESDEDCDGNEVNMLGEKGLFQLLAEKNIQIFKQQGVKNIVTLSPHAYNAMKNEYPKFGGNFELMHYTQVLREFIRNGKLDVSQGYKTRVTYHDSCLLGRYNQEYDAPRDILQDIPGIELIEMDRNRENSFCCGGGGGNFYTEHTYAGEDSPSRIRVKEAYQTGAEVLAVSCPTCLIMLEDAVKVEGLEKELIVKDISEIVNESIVPSLKNVI